MPLLINTKLEVKEDEWELIPQGETGDSLPTSKFVAMADLLNADINMLPEHFGVWLDSADEVESLEPYLGKISKVACKVENFMDGRNFSHARILRDQLGFTGAIRAVGSFIQDQLFFLKRCGFDEFEISNSEDAAGFSKSLSDFSESYQAACDNSVPLFRRRG